MPTSQAGSISSSESRSPGSLNRSQTSQDEPPETQHGGQLRVIVQTDSYDQTLVYFRDVLGLPTAMTYDLPGDDRVTILDAGRATLEIATAAHVEAIDVIERTEERAPQFRLAFEADDATATTEGLVTAGALPLAPPTPTPWGSLNARVLLAEGVHLTVFQPLNPGPETGPTIPTGDHHD
jgi:catechol 2,3-dioxygenase-like lactoylglutathione lyase family enzyme